LGKWQEMAEANKCGALLKSGGFTKKLVGFLKKSGLDVCEGDVIASFKSARVAHHSTGSMNYNSIEFPSKASAEPCGGFFVRSPAPSWKRFLDIACIIIVAPVVLPLGFLVAFFIKAVSPGPALFKQERVGYGGRRFLCLKFRTMRVNAETGMHKGHFHHLMTSKEPMIKLDQKGDPRLIRFGLLLRTLGVDELPQFINVLRGEMSLVGPRPCIPYEYEQFLPQYRKRCDTLPGITGLWQVNGKNRTTFERMVELDLEYVEKKSLLLDLEILVRTIPAILGQAWHAKMRGSKSARGV
jgi:lipopolysaccharide/colanic/teichoic acid biosynthesis glycosyltransferase